MDLTTYTGLQAAIASFLNRADLTAQIPAFIALAEARFNRELRVNAMLQRDYTVATEAYVKLPDDWLQHSSLVITDPPNQPRALDYITPEEFNDRRGHLLPGTPRAYTIVSDNIALLPTPGANVQLEITYYKKIPALSADTPSNWLLAKSPDLYLYTSLLQAEAYLINDERIALWGGAVDQTIEKMRMESERASRPSGALVARAKTFG
jgi:hypothetical protein